MTHSQVFRHQSILRLHDVVVIVVWKARAQAIGWLGRFPRAERVRHDNEVAIGVKRLSRPEKFPGEVGVEHVRPRSRRAMQDQHRLPGRRTDDRVIQLQFGQHLACVEAKVPDYPLSLIWSRIACGPYRQSERANYKSARNTQE